MNLTKWLSFVFFLSGVSALIYQVVWQRLLTLYYGVGPVSMTLIVSIYMVGLGFGALCGGYLSERVKHKIGLYALIEFLIGCFGLVSLAFLDFLGRHTAGSSYVLSFVYMILFLLIPTFLMGTTLPLLTKIFNRCIHDFSDTISFLYFINTLGAAIGAIFASYGLISFLGLDSAIYWAVVINFLLAGIIVWLSRAKVEIVEPSVDDSQKEEKIFLGVIAYFFVFITGFLAIGYEIIWFRVIGILVKSSPYAFSSILFVYLLGIALGSWGMGGWLRRYPATDKKNLFFLMQFLIALVVIVLFFSYYYLTKYTTFALLTSTSFMIQEHPTILFGLEPYDTATSLWVKIYALLDMFFWPLFFVFIPTLFMGANFPLIAQLALRENDVEGQTVGYVYFFNIMGNVLGGVATGFLLLPLLGTEKTVLIFVTIGFLFGFFMTIGQHSWRPAYRFILVLLLMAPIYFMPAKGDLYRLMHSSYDKKFLQSYVEEGIDGIVATYSTNTETLNFINGTTQGGRPAYMFYAQVIEGASFVRPLRHVLVIGYGTGGVVEAALKIKGVEKVTVVELSDTLMKNLKKIPIFQKMLSDPKIDLVIEDGRRFLLATDKKYDLIVCFLVRPTTAYSNNIYSREFFELIKEHLSLQGVFLVWTHRTDIVARTLAVVFEHLLIYRKNGTTFGIASLTPFVQDPQTKKSLVFRFPLDQQEWIIGSFPKPLADRAKILEMTNRMPINEDRKPVCEYYLGTILKYNLLQ